MTLIANSNTDSSTADITFTGAATFASAGPGFNAIEATAAHDINVNAAIVTSPAGDVFLEAGNNLTIKPNPGDGSITTAGAGGGTLTVNGGISIHDINVGAGNVTLIAHGAGADLTVGNLTLGASVTLEAPRDIIVVGTIHTTTATADITLIADVALTGTGGVWITSTGNIDAGRNVTIIGSQIFNPHPHPFADPATTTGASIQIDANTVSNDPIVAGGNITLQSSAAASLVRPDIIVDGVVRSTAAGTVDITAKHDIQLATTITSIGGAIQFHSPVILNAATAFFSGGGDLTIDGTAPIDSAAGTHNDLTVTAGTGNVVFSIAVGTGQSLGAFSVVSSKSFTESSAINAQTVSVNADNGVTFNGNVTTTANGTGTVTVNADTDSTGTGLFTVGSGATVNTDNSALAITAADATITGFLNSGSASTTIQTAQNETIGLGNTAGNLTIDGTELSNITANTMSLGSATTTSMTVDGIASDQSAHIGNMLLNALFAGSNISFLNNSSTFQTLVATAQNNIVFGPGLTVSAAAPATGSLTLTALTGAMSDTGALNLVADRRRHAQQQPDDGRAAVDRRRYR